MEQYIKECIQEIDNILENNLNKIKKEDIMEKHLTRISFIKHERLIHLLVTFFFSILTILSYTEIFILVLTS